MKGNSESFICILPFMVDELHFSGNDLIAYALIYGFSQDGKSSYRGGSQYLATRLGITKRAAITLLHRLVSSGHVIMVQSGCRKQYFCTRAMQGGKSEETSPKTVKKLHHKGEECSPKEGKKLHSGGEETSPRNKVENKVENKVCVDYRQRIYTYFYLHSAIDPYSETERFIAYYTGKKVPGDKLETKLPLWDFSKRKTQPLRHSTEFATFWASCCTFFPKEILGTACSEKVREDVSNRVVFIPRAVEDWICLPENEELLTRCRVFTRTTGNRFCTI